MSIAASPNIPTASVSTSPVAPPVIKAAVWLYVKFPMPTPVEGKVGPIPAGPATEEPSTGGFITPAASSPATPKVAQSSPFSVSPDRPLKATSKALERPPVAIDAPTLSIGIRAVSRIETQEEDWSACSLFCSPICRLNSSSRDSTPSSTLTLSLPRNS